MCIKKPEEEIAKLGRHGQRRGCATHTNQLIEREGNIHGDLEWISEVMLLSG